MTSRRIAVIGGGIAGLTAAYVLARTDEVTLFEADGRLGGHADTHDVTAADGRQLAVDTGFIVHNESTYPLLTRLFAELGVSTQDSEMSMSVMCAGCGLQYAGHRGLPGLAAGLRRGRGRYLRMLAEILRFHRGARALIGSAAAGSTGTGSAAAGSTGEGDGELTLGQFLADGGYSRYFTTHFAMPFVAAVWSCSPETALRYPARYLFTFLGHHGLLSVTGSPPWRTVTGGSRSYVDRVRKQLTSVRTGTAVTAVRRVLGGAEVRYSAEPDAAADEADAAAADTAASADAAAADTAAAHTAGQPGQPGRAAGTAVFDAVVVATHPDQALRMLIEPTPAEREVLGAFRYSRNPTVLHTDARVLPASPRVRSSWNYTLPSCAASASQVQVSYYMNRLQRLPGGEDYVVTLNAGSRIRAASVLARMEYEHPIYDPAAVAAQRRLPGLNDGVIAYAGAYHGWGFHEDGCRSGVTAAQSLGGRW